MNKNEIKRTYGFDVGDHRIRAAHASTVQHDGFPGDDAQKVDHGLHNGWDGCGCFEMDVGSTENLPYVPPRPQADARSEPRARTEGLWRT